MASSEPIDRALAEALVREGTLGRAALARANEHRQRTGGSLEDSLIELGLCGEREVLRALAKTWRFQYLMAEKAEQLTIADPVLERVPVRIAEEHWILPFRLDENEVLWILTAAPLADDVLVMLMRATGAKALNRLLVRRTTVWAAIRRHYYRDPAAFQRKPAPPSLVPYDEPDPQDPFDQSDLHSVSRTLRCPHCGAPASIENFQCRQCGLLLNPDATAERRGLSERSVVRALMSGGSGLPERREGNEDPTVKTAAPLDGSVVPVLVAGLDVVETPLSEFEAHIASFLDGETTVVDLARVARISEVETQAILRSLAARRIVDLARPQMKPHIAHALAQVRRANDPAPPSRGVPAGAADGDTARAHSVLQEAISLERGGQVEQAIRALREGITQLRRPAPLLNRLALVLLDQRGDHRAAEDLLKKACELDPTNEIYSRNLYKVLGLAAIRALAIEKK